MDLKNLLILCLVLIPQSLPTVAQTIAAKTSEGPTQPPATAAPAPPSPPPNLDASIQIVVGPAGAPSQGTIAYLPGEGYVIVTHDHFTNPSLDERDELYFKEYGAGSFTGKVLLAEHRPDSSRFDEVNLIPLGKQPATRTGAAARIAEPAEIDALAIGNWVVVVYNAGEGQGEFVLQVVSLQVMRISATSLTVADPERHMNRGDSGGAVYFNGALIGVLWSIGDYDFGRGVNVSLLRSDDKDAGFGQQRKPLSIKIQAGSECPAPAAPGQLPGPRLQDLCIWKSTSTTSEGMAQMIKVTIIPRIVYIGMLVMVFGALLSVGAYIFETQVLGMTTTLPLYELFADAFKVGLGAFIGVLSQWASRVFVNEAGQEPKKTEPAPEKPAAEG